MYFKRLELVGFKSFLNKTVLQFEPGITAIVGPNGCGKSNIFDSIRWVLGEQSVKSMRGSSMEDVIFNGTDVKEPLGMAEVSLAFDNENRFFPVDHNEVVVTRRIFRSGECEYLLNKAQVRLKDILELFMGTGMGAESYSLIPQGKVDLILSSKPEDRRIVFDEASGITKYKANKKEALKKIEETEQNLLRVNDIVAEVKRQIGSLERQANKARRFKEVFDELKAKEITLAGIQKKELLFNSDRIKGELAGLESRENQTVNNINEQESQILNLQSESKNKEDIIRKIKDEIMQLENLITRDNERIKLDKERITELEARKAQLISQSENINKRLKADEEKLNSLRQEADSIKKNIEAKAGTLHEKEGCLNVISSSIRSSVENIASFKKNILDLEIKNADTKNELSDLTSKQQIYMARQKRLQIEKAKVDEEISSFQVNIDHINSEIDTLTSEFNADSLKVSEIKKNLDSETVSLSNINAEIGLLEKQKMALLSQKQFLEELKIKYDDMGESMNAVIYLDQLPADKISGLVIKIKDYLDLNDNDKNTLSSSKLKVSAEAKLFDLDSRNINDKIAQTDQKITDLGIAGAEKHKRVEELNNIFAESQKSLRSREIVLSNKKTFQQSVLDEFKKIRDEEDLINIELSDMQAQLQSVNEKITGLKSSAEQTGKDLKAQEDSISNEQNLITKNNILKEEALVAIAQIKTELDSLNKQVSSEDSMLADLENRFSQDKDHLSSIEKQSEEVSSKQIFLNSEIKDLEGAVSRTNSDISSRRDSAEEADGAYREISAGLNEAVKRIESEKKELDTLKNKLYELQMQQKDVEFKYLSIKERLSQAYKIDFDAFGQDLTEDLSGIDENTLLEEIKKLREKTDSYGNVNLVAIEEYDELKKRYDFLGQQQTDLLTAKESLHQAILKINRTTKKLFLETFEKIRVEFRDHFRLLFNGGDAQIYLIDEQDPLESGIEIICRPPGKKLQNVLLLSGGEKTMSAIALIFAIFKIKPAPFCVLDEIDAALDEANVDRFGKVLQEFSKISQFIVITHNKKTISNADIMYGITMEESGVSKIVSVKFAQNKPSGFTPKAGPEALAEPV